MANRAAILRWTGRGSLTRLRSSVEHVLGEKRLKGRVERTGSSLVVECPEPVEMCLALEFMPGVAWGAVGYTAEGLGEMAKASSALAARYLRRGSKFSVWAEAKKGLPSSDLAGVVTSAMLERAKGARVDGRSPKVRFRAAIDGPRGAVGVEIVAGPGGVPTGSEEVAVLVSGGIHSSVVAWNAALSGFRVRLIHARSDEPGLHAAAKLYSELSNRMDPRGIALTVLEGGPAGGLLAKFAARSKTPVFGGFTVERPEPSSLRGKVGAPLYLMAEDEFAAQFESLRLKNHAGYTDWKTGTASQIRARSFGGKSADVSGVLDGLE